MVVVHVRSGFRPGRLLFSPPWRTHHDPAPATLHRRSASAQLGAPNHRHLRPPRGLLRQALRPLPGTARPQRGAQLPTAPASAARLVEQLQPGGVRAAFPVRRHAGSARATAADSLRQTAQGPAERAQSRRGAALARRRHAGSRPRALASSLRLRPALERADSPAGPRRRQRPHGPSRPPGQGSQGPARAAVAAPARGAARLLADVPAAHLAGPRPQAGAADHRQQHPAALCPASPAGRPEQTRFHAHAPAQLRHPPLGGRRRSAHAQGAARPHQPANHRSLPARQHAPPGANAAPARPARVAPTDCRDPADRAGPADRPGHGGGGRHGGPGMTAPMTERPAREVAGGIRQHGEVFLDRYGGLLSAAQRQALRDLAACRTAALGGHIEHCLDGGHERIAYHSCRNRHWPTCQALARARWLDQQAEQLLPVAYHHGVFPLPAAVAEVALANPTVLYDLRLRGAAAALREVAANPKRLGAVIGVRLGLHTWGQNRHHHPHVHCVVTGGGRSCDPAGKSDAAPRWVACRPGFFLPVRGRSRVFRGKFLAGLNSLFEQGTLLLPGRLRRLAEPSARAAWWEALYAKEWVVYSKRPFGGPEQVLKYLACYSHRAAISNSRLESLDDGRVTFRCKDYGDGGRTQRLTLEALEFLRRFVQHGLPRGFVKVRHYGLLANAQREARRRGCRRLLLGAAVAAPMPGADPVLIEPAPPRCGPECGGTRLVYRELAPAEPAPARAAPLNSS